MGRAEEKSKAPHSRKPAHQAPIHRGSSGVMPRLPGERQHKSIHCKRREKALKEHGRNIKLTGFDEHRVHIELGADGAEDEATGRPEHQGRKEDSCTPANISFS